MSKTLAHTVPRPLPTRDRLGTGRDLIAFVGRHGAVSIAHVRVALGVRQSAAYDRIAALIEAGLLERLDLLRGEPTLLRATRSGLRYAGLAMAPALVSPGSVDHWLRCTSVALELEALHGAHRVLTERELLVAERHEERPIASAKVGELPNGSPRLHRPDLVVLPPDHPLVRFHQEGVALNTRPSAGNQTDGPGEDDKVFSTSPADQRSPERGDPGSDRGPGSTAHARTRQRGSSDPSDVSGGHQREGGEAEALMPGGEITSCDERLLAGAEHMRAYVTEDTGMRSVPEGLIAVEVELTPKSPKRLREIIRAWRRASWVAEVHYLCEPGQTRRAVERAVEKLHAQDRIVIGEVPRARSEQASISATSRRERSASRCSE